MSKLFSALRIGQLELSHRLVTPVRAESRFDVADYRRRATAGGLLVVEVSPEHATDQQRWERVTGAIHEEGAIVVALLAPSSAPRADDVEVDLAMDDIQRAAKFARSVGFDGVELDARDGSLPARFLHAETNSRADDYGGDAERRMRFLLEAAYVISEECSNERVGVRLSPCAREGQRGLLAEVMRAVSERELAYIHLAKAEAPPALRISLATCADRRAFRSDISCALLASDDCDLEVAASVVESRWADAVGFLRANDDPDFVSRALAAHRS